MKILILEDEPKTANILKEIILQIDSSIQILAVIDSVQGAVQYLGGALQAPDLIFMDIQLADGTCFEIFDQIKTNSPVVFCTAYHQFTLQAFKANGIDYILKPVKTADVSSALLKYSQLKQTFSQIPNLAEILRDAFSPQKNYKNTILVRSKENYIPLPLSKVMAFVVDTEIAYALTFDSSKYAIFKPMQEIEADVSPHVFFRINRQTLINRNAIKEIEPYFNRKVVVKTQPKINYDLVVSRLKVTEFLNWIEQA